MVFEHSIPRGTTMADIREYVNEYGFTYPIVNFILDNGNVNDYNIEGPRFLKETILTYILSRYNIRTADTVERVIDKNVNVVNNINHEGRNALICGISNFDFRSENQYNTIELLIEHTDDINLQDEEGLSALMVAVMLVRGPLLERLILKLIEKGSNRSLEDNMGANAYEIYKEHVEMEGEEINEEIKDLLNPLYQQGGKKRKGNKKRKTMKKKGRKGSKGIKLRKKRESMKKNKGKKTMKRKGMKTTKHKRRK